MFAEHHFLPLALINLLGLAGILVWHIQGRNRPTGRLIVQILFFATMSLVLGMGRISPFQLDQAELKGAGLLLAKSARILWWSHLAWTIIGFLHIYIGLNHRPREAHLLQDLIVALVYLGVALSIIGFVFGAPIGPLVATSGVVAVIIGLALQNTLADVFSGIALTLGRAYVIGDWIRLSDGTEGRVAETNWRSTNLLTGAHNELVVPNSVLAKQGVTNLSRPDETHWLAFAVHIAATHAPSVVEEIMLGVLRNSERIVKVPAPAIALKAIDAMAIEVELQFCVASPATRMPAKNEVIDLVYRGCKANGLSLAMPPESLLWGPAVAAGEPAANLTPLSSRYARASDNE
ncbi:MULTISPECIES: mechanosensitive ion channel family protein [Sinorhizobium]|uniref:mechanosensitive ion channel family protein n=1 Tax=Sinorhizobium TaxID=28105 RepID=UPI000360BA82|nr:MULTISPECIES: mechanosensitive ion channel family protein [Sinorhizobium]PND23079.1 mechanosensitive ion channel family protein [Ensifer sp. MMN_5]PND25831.1 mechanosensitive ion channel family protein [Sinorhizobium sp. M4_45]